MGKYDLTNQLTPVQSTFVDPGVETFKQAAAIYRKTYDQNKDAYNLSKRVMAQMDLMPGDEQAGLRDQFSGTINQTFEDIIAIGNFEDAEMAVQNAVDYISTDKTVTQARKNAEQYQKEEALIEQFGPSGILDFNKDLRSSFTTVTADEEGNPVVNSYKEAMEQKEDYYTYMSGLTKGIAPDGRTWGNVIGNFYQYGNSKGVGKNKIERIVNNLYEAYIGDKVGDQDFRRLTQIEGMTPEAAKQDIIRRMTNVAMKQEGITRTISGMKDLTPSGPSGGGVDPFTTDPMSVHLLSSQGDDIGYNLWRGYVDAPDGDVAGSIKITNSSGLVLDYAKQFTDDQLRNVTSGLLSTKLVSTEEDALAMITPLLSFKSSLEGNKREQALKIAQDLGYMGDGWDQAQADELYGLCKGVGAVIGQEKLDAMGAILDAKVNGSFVLSTASGGTNFRTIGTDFQSDGLMYLNEEQMNRIANQTGKGDVGAFFSFDDIDDLKLDGKKLFTKTTIDGTDYWTIPTKHQFAFNNDRGDAGYSVQHSESSIGKYDVPLHETRNNIVKSTAILTSRRPAFNIVIGKSVASNKLELKKLYKETAEDLKKHTFTIYGNTPSAPGIYNMYLEGLEIAIEEAIKEGDTSKLNIGKKLDEQLKLIDNYIIQGAGQ